MRANPVVYEINTWVWLNELSTKYGRRVTLADVPDEQIAVLLTYQTDAIWLMGVWERSPAGRQIAIAHTGLQGDYNRALPDWTPDDVVGSPYAVRRYVVDGRLGGRDGLAQFRNRLAAAGVKLILDYVPNHVAVDHPWVFERDTVLIKGAPEELRARPGDFFQSQRDESGMTMTSAVIAHGRDPYFPPWTDTAQVNAFSADARAASLETLLDLADQCDGVRCDMAMLMVNRIFDQTWGRRGGDIPATEFWTDIIGGVRAKSPDFLFMAEVYWNMESDLITLGFDYCYDKHLYDYLLKEGVQRVRGHLTAPISYQRRMVRFIENHDEARASASFEDLRALAAAAIVLVLPGMKLFYEGQFEGRERKLPVQLGRRSPEPVKAELQAAYHTMLQITAPQIHDGVFSTIGVQSIHDDGRASRNIFAHMRSTGDDPERWQLALINYSDEPVEGRALLVAPNLSTGTWQLVPTFHPDNAAAIDGAELLAHGYPFRLPAFGFDFFGFARA